MGIKKTERENENESKKRRQKTW